MISEIQHSGTYTNRPGCWRSLYLSRLADKILILFKDFPTDRHSDKVAIKTRITKVFNSTPRSLSLY
ncbi:hypothetical protein DQM68_10575 [Leptospira mayottensis]|uniref:Uncharacterized protein n=1 Tax=Leptospira mayottensis 200901122 TaxID=1193010 RepID=A0AA87MSY9_9LEPT|nr:hypothetical protein DQM68_10575 [Leptospira mayottensis]EKS01380.1 hypothetical protein LEP1GSC125_0527 [Leptospira mayottensis 200901122]